MTAEAPAEGASAAEAGDADGAHPEAESSITSARRIWRGVARAIALLAVTMTLVVVTLAIGMRRNDAAIENDYATATATVLTVSPLRTGIEFIDQTGATVRPENGVLYPGLLSVGQQFVVEYSTKDPQIARVAGRTAGVANLMLVAALAITVVGAAPLIWFCLRRARLPLLGFRRGPGHASPPGTAAGTNVRAR
jgi:hypothetical protein